MTPVRLEPAAPPSRVKHFTTEPLHSHRCHLKIFLIYSSSGPFILRTEPSLLSVEGIMKNILNLVLWPTWLLTVANCMHIDCHQIVNGLPCAAKHLWISNDGNASYMSIPITQFRQMGHSSPQTNQSLFDFTVCLAQESICRNCDVASMYK